MHIQTVMDHNKGQKEGEQSYCVRGCIGSTYLSTGINARSQPLAKKVLRVSAVYDIMNTEDVGYCDYLGTRSKKFQYPTIVTWR